MTDPFLVTANLYKEEYWEVHDPGNAKIIAHFFNGEQAQDYVEWLNKKIAKKQREPAQ